MRTQSKLPIWLTKEELVAVLAAASSNLRDQIALEFCVTFALRRSELVSLRLKNLANGMIRCERAKGSLPVHQFIPAALAAKLAEYLAGEGRQLRRNRWRDAESHLQKICGKPACGKTPRSLLAPHRNCRILSRHKRPDGDGKVFRPCESRSRSDLRGVVARGVCEK
jgi:integrase